jgi:hypothetical protein
VAVIAIAALAGCAPSSAPSPTDSPTGSAAQSTTPKPATEPALKGCDLVNTAEASSLVGAAFPAGKENPFTPSARIVAHTGCGYQDGPKALGFDLNTLAPAIPVATWRAGLMGALISKGATTASFGGNAGISYAKDSLQEVAFTKDQVTVVITVVNGTPGSAVAVANLIADRM